MMVNNRRGEIAATLNDKDWILCLTLGALAGMEAAYETEDLSALIARFSTGKLKSQDIIRIVTAGLQGGGHDVAEDDVADMRIDGGAVGFAQLVTQLLEVTFGTSGGTSGNIPENPTQSKN